MARPSASLLFLWLLLWAIWLVANASLSADVVITGGVVSLPIAAIFAAPGRGWHDIVVTPRRLYHFLAYTTVFIRELVLANISIMKWVFSPSIDIKPGVVRIKTRLKTPIGRLSLANSIALTPGSLVLDIEDDTLLIHWLDVQTYDTEEATRLIAGVYEKHLEKVFG